MKKSVFILSTIIVLLVLSSFSIQAVDTLTTPPTPDTIAPATTTDTNTTTPKTDASDEPVIPASLQKLFKVIFRLKEVNFSEVVIMSALLILSILIIQQGFSLGFEDKTASWLIAIVISLIASSSGAIQYATVFWEKIGEALRIPGSASTFWVSAGIIILIIVYFVLLYFKKTSEEAEIIINARKIGEIEGMKDLEEKIEAKVKKTT